MCAILYLELTSRIIRRIIRYSHRDLICCLLHVSLSHFLTLTRYVGQQQSFIK